MGRLRQRAEPPHVVLLDLTGKVPGGGEREAAGELRRGHGLRQLQQGQGVATRLGDDPIADMVIEPARDDRDQEGASVVLGEPAEGELRQAVQHPLVRRLAHGEDDQERLGQHPPGDEPEDLARRSVEPLRVVDEAQQWPLGGDLRQEAERGERHEEPVGGAARREAEGDAQCVLLRFGDRVEVRQHRPAQLVQPGERQLHLGLDTRDPSDPEAGRLPSAMAQECGLAHAGLTTDGEDGAVASAGIFQQLVQHTTLRGATTERRGALSSHAPGSVSDQGDGP